MGGEFSGWACGLDFGIALMSDFSLEDFNDCMSAAFSGISPVGLGLGSEMEMETEDFARISTFWEPIRRTKLRTKCESR